MGSEKFCVDLAFQNVVDHDEFNAWFSEDPSLPDQVFGTFIGWAGTGTAWTIKVVVNIGWNCSSCTKQKRIWVTFILSCIPNLFDLVHEFGFQL